MTRAGALGSPIVCASSIGSIVGVGSATGWACSSSVSDEGASCGVSAAGGGCVGGWFACAGVADCSGAGCAVGGAIVGGGIGIGVVSGGSVDPGVGRGAV